MLMAVAVAVADIREMCLGLASIGGVTQSGAADGLGDGALDAGADVVAGLPLFGLLLGVLLCQDLLMFSGQQGQLAAPLAVRRFAAPVPQRARVAVGEREAHSGDGGAAGFALVGPAGADRSLGAGDLSGVPVDVEGGLGQIRCLLIASAVAGVSADRPNQGDAVVVVG